MSDPKPAARTGDPTEHGGVITGGSKNVLINNLGAARISDYHTCPQVADRVHVGGIIAEASKTVVFNNLRAARVGDKLFCSGPEGPPPPKEEEGSCEWEVDNGAGREVQKHDGKGSSKDFLYGLDVERSCSVARPIDGEIEGVLGKGEVKVDVLKGEGKLQVGVSREKDKVTAGAQVGLGGSLVEGEAKYTSPLLRIPFTDIGIGFEGEAKGSLGTLEVQAGVGATFEDGKLKIFAFEKLGAIVGQGLKGGLVIQLWEPEPVAALPPDKISKGSSNVVIG